MDKETTADSNMCLTRGNLQENRISLCNNVHTKHSGIIVMSARIVEYS